MAKRNNAHLSFGVPVDRAGQRDVSRAWRDGFYDQVADHPKWTYWQARLAGWDNVQNYLFARRCGQEWAQEVGGLSSHGREGQQAMDALSAFHALPSEANWYALGEAVGAMRKAVRRTDVPAPFTNPADEETSVSEREVVPEPAQAEMAGQGVAGSALSGDAAARPAAADTRTEWAVRFISLRSSGYEFLAERAIIGEAAARGEAEQPHPGSPPRGRGSGEVVCPDRRRHLVSLAAASLARRRPPPSWRAELHTAAETLRRAQRQRAPPSSEAAAAVAVRLQAGSRPHRWDRSAPSASGALPHAGRHLDAPAARTDVHPIRSTDQASAATAVIAAAFPYPVAAAAPDTGHAMVPRASGPMRPHRSPGVRTT